MSGSVHGSTVVARVLPWQSTRAAARPVTPRAVRAGARPPLRLVGPAVPAVRPVGRPARLRLTRRGRVVVRLAVILLGVLVTAGAVLGGGRVAQAGEMATAVPVAYHLVQPGETLWRIAGQVAPGVDRRETMARIVELNALENGSLQAGRRIAVPIAD